MKIIYAIPLLIVVFNYATGKSYAQTDTSAIVLDTKPMIDYEYDLVIFEPGFEVFLSSQLPIEHYAPSYYWSNNLKYVSSWNTKALQNKLAGAYQEQIMYYPNIDYGVELNYKLFYFFKYIEEKYNTILVPNP
jgi:hypothetical protein